MGDDAIHKAAAIAAIAILLILAVMVRACALFPRGTLISQNMAHSDRRGRLNTPVSLVPLSGTHLQQVKSGREVVQLHRRQLAHRARPVHSVAPLRPPPPAYNSGGAVHVVSPPYTADPNGDADLL